MDSWTLKPHIYKFYGRWCWSSHGRVKIEYTTLTRIGIHYRAADEYVKRLNRKAGLTP